MAKQFPFMLLADTKGRIFNHPYLRMVGQQRGVYRLPQPEELIPLPSRSRLFFMPGYKSVGWNSQENRYETLTEYRINCRIGGVFPVSAFLTPGYTRLLLPAIKAMDKTPPSKVLGGSIPVDETPLLPLWPYTAVGWQNGKFWAAAVRIDKSTHWRLCYFNDQKVASNIKERLKKFPHNRLIRHLSNCALNYRCFAAMNLFLQRWEIPLPTSPVCNSKCIGCISRQHSGCPQASHERIRFVPTPSEIVQIALPHLRNAPEAVVSFGQGCEGEPLLQVETLEETIRILRMRTSRGTINLNTNGFSPFYVKRLAQAGLDSIRISLNSVQKDYYNAYFRPQDYQFKDVIKSIKLSKDLGLFVSINLFVFPGITDSEKEIAALIRLIKKTNLDMIQMRNLSIPSEFYNYHMPPSNGKIVGILEMIKILKEEFPRLLFGYFNRPKEYFTQ
ncbi:MAG: radical SAM protein [Candidatus Omnitrophica bacterium]|nr:radical SAM protein [Candidatus Omnitrophota bacterium]MBU1809539.1 radical SAM protein [Candidatus Omnitrophota bacterium]